VVDWRVDRSGGTCVKTGRPFKPGETFHVVLFEDGEGFRREDYCDEAWDKMPEGAFCTFLSHMPVDQKPKKKRLLVDDDVLIDFFVRLKNEQESVRQQFRFVLALILMRKRLLKYDETINDGELEVWRMRLMRDKTEHTVINPKLTDDQIETVSRQLGSVLHADAGQFDDDVEDQRLQDVEE